jgi:hypothetical protein
MTLVRHLRIGFLISISEAWQMSTVEKVRLQDFDANAYYENGPKPLLISGVLSPDDCEYCSDTLFSLSSQLHVCLQNQYEGGQMSFMFP